MAQFFLEAFQWHGVKRGDAFAFYAGGIRVEGPHPFCSSGGNLGNGRTRTAMYTDSIEQLRGTAGARQWAETALAGFTTPSSGGWIMFGKELRWRSPARGAGRLDPTMVILDRPQSVHPVRSWERFSKATGACPGEVATRRSL